MRHKSHFFTYIFLFGFLFFGLLFGEIKEVKASNTKYNYNQIDTKPFDYFEDFLSYLDQQGKYRYNESFKGEDNQRYIKLNVTHGGTLMIVELSNDNVDLAVYDASKKKIGSLNSDNSFLQMHVMPGTYYVKLPNSNKEIILTAMVYKDSISLLKNKYTILQSGSGHYDYKKFYVKGRREVTMIVDPLFAKNTPVFTYLQKWRKGKWVKVTNVVRYTTSSYSSTSYGLSKGTYRIATKTSKNQGFTLYMQQDKKKKNYKTKQLSATRIKANRSKNHMFTITEKKARWYLVNRRKQSGRHFLMIGSDMNSGKIKAYIYKKGIKKPIKKLTLGKNTKRYRLRYGKGIYYVKIIKGGAKTNGNYYLHYSIE